MDKEEILTTYHKSLSDLINIRETELTKFIGIIISALAVFCISVLNYLKPNIGYKYILLMGGYSASVMLCGWGMFLALKMGYLHRSFQMVLCKLEKNININLEPLKTLADKLPASWRMESKNWTKKRKRWISRKDIDDLLPDIYQLHFYMLIWCIFLMSLIMFLLNKSAILLTLILGVILFCRVNKCFNRYYKKLRGQREELKI